MLSISSDVDDAIGVSAWKSALCDVDGGDADDGDDDDDDDDCARILCCDDGCADWRGDIAGGQTRRENLDE